VRIAAESVIGNIEDDGYLRISDEELAGPPEYLQS
jgi:hypothetical protein